MLTALSIRDIVLIEKLDIGLERGLTVLSGETGAGKSILLDALGLALGARGDSSLVRTGAERGVVTAAFALPAGHAALRAGKQGIDGEANGDPPHPECRRSEPGQHQRPAVSLNLRQVAEPAEIHGQHADRALVDVANHRCLLDAFGGLEGDVQQVAKLWTEASAARAELDEHCELMARAEAERDYLDHAVEELRALDPKPGEETKLAEARQIMMNAEQYSEALGEAEDALARRRHRSPLNAALRKLNAGAKRRRPADRLVRHADRVLVRSTRPITLAEARAFAFDPGSWKDRRNGLRAAPRPGKHKSSVDDLLGAERFERITGDLRRSAPATFRAATAPRRRPSTTRPIS
jgi:DNA repair protein RecN (Recombination protein N)